MTYLWTCSICGSTKFNNNNCIKCGGIVKHRISEQGKNSNSSLFNKSRFPSVMKTTRVLKPSEMKLIPTAGKRFNH